MRRERVRLGPRHQFSVYASVALLVLSGLLWLGFHYFLRQTGEFGEQPHPLEYWWLRLHGAAAMLSLIVLGSLLPMHVRRAWQRRKNRYAGVALGSVFGLLILSGYCLYYFSSESLRWIGVLHWIVGLALPLSLAVHVVVGRWAMLQDPPVR